MEENLLYLYYIFLALLPSTIWLAFYLRKDSHPEPNAMVIQIFVWGILISPIALLLELMLVFLVSPDANLAQIFNNHSDNYFKAALIATLIPASVEEYLKYAVVKSRVLKNPEFDEPLDVMLYCIIAALGFAAIENILVLMGNPIMPLNEAVMTMVIRFLGATFLHALAAGIVGYFLARGLCQMKYLKLRLIQGLGFAILCHACYNYFITKIAESGKLIYLQLIFILLISMAVFVSQGFNRLKKELSICK